MAEHTETFTTLEVAVKQDTQPKLDKCCYCVDLRVGLNCWLGVECALWIFLFVSAAYFEIIYIGQVDLMDFIDETEQWYFFLIFGDRFYYLDQQTRSKFVNTHAFNFT